MPARWITAMGRVPWRRIGAATWRGFRKVFPRVYALGLAVVIGYLTFAAVRYLIVSLATRAGPPPQIVALPTRLDAATLAAGRSAFAALDAAEHPRSPLAHYHRLDEWIAPDAHNDCARSGCHAPLPHARSKELRAFLNMHASSMHCGVCHMQTEHAPLRLVWYDLVNGTAQGPPPLLEAYELILSAEPAGRASGRAADRAEAQRKDEAFARRLVGLLNRAAEVSGGSRSLRELASHLRAVRPGSPAFDKLLASAREALPRHFRGEYGAKLAMADDQGRPLLGHPGAVAADAARRFLAVGHELPGPQREDLLRDVHPLRRTEPRACTNCHRAEGGLVDFKAIGIPGPRVDALVNPVVFRMIEHIGEGRPFGLPEFLQGREATTRPSGERQGQSP